MLLIEYPKIYILIYPSTEYVGGGVDDESILIISLNKFKLDFIFAEPQRCRKSIFKVLRTILTFLAEYLLFHDLFTCFCPKWAKGHTSML